MKLELKHLAPYLPYGLMLKINTPIGIFNRKLQLDCGHDFNLHLSECNIKPILRPLSDLTKEIEVNGEKFVPMYKLCKKQGFSMPDSRECEYEFVSKFNQIATIKMNGWIFRYLNDEKSFWLNGTESWSKKHQKSNKQLELFQMLFEWHFDVFGLIEKKLAIDKNTLNQ